MQGCRLLTRGSYMLTLIVMMAWSITYHSWLTFVLLIWSCVLWMMPSSRQACLRSSPALVAYAELLLLLQYLYSLDLTDKELPQHVNTVNLAQLGLIKYAHDAYQPLSLKVLYTVMFWITLRQYFKLKRSPVEESIDLRRRGSTVTFSISTQLLVRRLGRLVQQWLTRYWIWVVASMLMFISLGGEQVVLYRIVYMLLFLFFVTVFQVSYQLWIKVMYSFWLTVIIYSMLVLILIYSYQFEHFPEYWEHHLRIPVGFQKDIGLEVYQADPGTLFLKLLTPTFFLIITIIQLHYFHNEFIKLNEDNFTYSVSVSQMETCVAFAKGHANAIPKTPPIDLPSIFSGEGSSLNPIRPSLLSHADPASFPRFLRHISSSRARRFFPSSVSSWTSIFWLFGRELYKCRKIVWRLLEIHMAKVVLLTVFGVAISDVSAVHVIFVLGVVLALPFRWLQPFLIHCCSVWTSILFLAKMVYQLSFVDVHGWHTNCSVSLFSSFFFLFFSQSVYGIDSNVTVFPAPFNSTIDGRVWIGFQKVTDLSFYSKGYILLIVVFSVHAIIRYRQRFYRARNRLPEPRPGVVFPSITRHNADDGIREALKFLLNYFFYKFGVEASLFYYGVFSIGIRLDAFALLTSLWLCGMFLLRRRYLAKVWAFYVAYLCFVLPLQYAMVMGIPPGLCTEYPWWNPSKKTLRETALWFFLPDFQEPPLAWKLWPDFIQLLFACCQLYVFFLESSPGVHDGGSNREIYDRKGCFVGQIPNPISDFRRSYLSTVKVFLFFPLYWITLAVMFLAGTNRVSIFAMGYVLGCFFFLWNGNEFYLKPMNVLLKMWNALLAYNVVVIFIKSILQQCGTNANTEDGVCRVPLDEAGLLWDGICLTFLLVQKRLFTSYYFHHLIIEILAQQQLASR
ncbi:unnamed protein product, partial [Ixodes persulcatus]